jgi:hypothetical protein
MNKISEDLEITDTLLNNMSEQDVFITYQALILALQFENYNGKKINSLDEYQEFIDEYKSSFVIKDAVSVITRIFCLSPGTRPPLLDSLHQRTRNLVRVKKCQTN